MPDFRSPPLSDSWPFFAPTKRLKFTFCMIESALDYAVEEAQFDFDKINWRWVFEFLFQKEAGLTLPVTKHFRQLYEVDRDRVVAEIYLIIRRLRERCARERPNLYPQN